MIVWEVGVSDCESCETICICSTKEIALREMFKERDRLVTEWKEQSVYEKQSMKEFIKEQADKGIFYPDHVEPDMYDRMIKALSHDNYEKWDNYPHSVPWIKKTEVIDS